MGKARKNLSCLVFAPLSALPAGPDGKLRNSFSVSLWFLLEAFYTFSLVFHPNAGSFCEINAKAQMEKLDSSCRESCVLWAMYLVSSL